MDHRRQIIFLIFLCFQFLMVGCLLEKPILPKQVPAAPSDLFNTPEPESTIQPYTSATGQSMKETVFAQFDKKRPLDLLREHPDPIGLLVSLPGILLFFLGGGSILHYWRVKRRGWDVVARMRGFDAFVGVIYGKSAKRAEKEYYWSGWIFLILGIANIIVGILVAFFDLF
jgi:hypothetical protein